MPNIVSCLQQHDLSLIAWSVLTCIVSIAACQGGFRRAVAAEGRQRALWLAAAVLLFGLGAWTTHFTAMLAYRQDIRAGFDLGLAGMSGLVALAGVACGLAVALKFPNLAGRCLAGLLCGGAITAMNFLGVAAMMAPGVVVWDASLAVAAITIGVAGVSAAAAVNPDGPISRRIAAAVFTATAILAVHFATVAAATTVAPAPVWNALGLRELEHVIGPLTLLNLLGGVMLLISDRFGELTIRRQLDALDHAPAALAFFDRAERLLMWNEAYAEMLRTYGIAPSRGLHFSFVTLNARTNVPAIEFDGVPVDLPDVTLAGALAFGKVGSIDVPLPDGRWFQCAVRSINDGGFVVVLTDVTERRELMRREAEARTAAEAANRAKSEFLANMSHEIRTPLNGVLGMVQIMARNPLEDEQRHRLEIIGEAGQALLNVLNNVLDLSKIEAGKVEFEVHPFDIEDVVGAVTAAHAPLAAQKDVAFVVDFDPDARGIWSGDSGKLRQVLSNLLSNAIKFTSEGAVTLRVAWAADGLSFEVSDTGVGIASDKLELIFDKFTQADASTTRRFGGSGLGLAICRQLVELMGGMLYVASQEEAGSTFGFGVPMTRSEVQPQREAKRRAEPQARPETLRILAAEDNATNQLILSALLEPLGVDLIIVENGRLAVEAHARGAFDLILMDAQMPELNGVEATRAIRAHEQTTGAARIPIIALTANVMQHQINEYLSVGMDAFVAKPISATVLIEAIEDALDSRAPRREPSQESCAA